MNSLSYDIDNAHLTVNKLYVRNVKSVLLE